MTGKVTDRDMMKKWSYFGGHVFDFRGSPPPPDWFVYEVDATNPDYRPGWYDKGLIAVAKTEALAMEIVDAHNQLIESDHE